MKTKHTRKKRTIVESLRSSNIIESRERHIRERGGGIETVSKREESYIHITRHRNDIKNRKKTQNWHLLYDWDKQWKAGPRWTKDWDKQWKAGPRWIKDWDKQWEAGPGWIKDRQTMKGRPWLDKRLRQTMKGRPWLDKTSKASKETLPAPSSFSSDGFCSSSVFPAHDMHPKRSHFYSYLITCTQKITLLFLPHHSPKFQKVHKNGQIS